MIRYQVLFLTELACQLVSRQELPHPTARQLLVGCAAHSGPGAGRGAPALSAYGCSFKVQARVADLSLTTVALARGSEGCRYSEVAVRGVGGISRGGGLQVRGRRRSSGTLEGPTFAASTARHLLQLAAGKRVSIAAFWSVLVKKRAVIANSTDVGCMPAVSICSGGGSGSRAPCS